MKLAIMQPYFLPYLGYFSLIKQTDKFILLDTVQFIKHGWIERNRILSPNGEPQYIAIPLEKHSQTTLIKDIRIRNQENWKEKIKAQLVHYKKRAPYYTETMNIMDNILNYETDSIVKMNQYSLKCICDYLGINAVFSIFSEMNLNIEKPCAPDEWALNICKAMGDVNEYWNPTGGATFFDKSKYPSGCKVFVNSMSDTFHKEISYSHIKMLFNLMGARSDVTFQVLTKRHLRMYTLLKEFPELVTPNIWVGVTAENQKMVDSRVDWLVNTKKEIKRLANKDITIFVSCEPLLESIDLSKYINELDWVIVGGERTNKKGRVMQFEWVERIYLQCRQSDTPFFFKQWGDGEAEAKAEIKGDDITLVEVIEAKKEFPKEMK